MKSAISSVSSLWSRFLLWLPDSVDRRVRALAWASLVFQIALIGTGGAVRLTDSGLGCPTWPNCTATSFVTTNAMGVHGIIEFTNRMLTFVLSIVVIAAFLAVVRMYRTRRDLFVLALLQGLSIPLQAVIGGISVLTGLNPYIVGLHFVLSIGLVALTTMMVFRTLRGPRGRERVAPAWFLAVAHTTSLFVLVTVVLGILTTGAGPNAGDANSARNGLDIALLEHLHSIPAYATFGLTLVLVVGVLTAGGALRGIRPFALALLSIEVVQIIVGISQANFGLPGILVGIHMVLAGLLVCAMTAVILSLRSSNAPASAPLQRDPAVGARA